MQTNRSNPGLLAVGILLIVFGLLAMANQFFDLVDWGSLWPVTIIGLGILFFVAMFAGGRQVSGLAVPGSIITGVGLILLYQSITGHWESWAYSWALIIVFVGVGIYIMGWYGGDTGQKKSGMDVMRIGTILFVIFGVFFEMIFSSFDNLFFPILLIGLGAYLILSRSGLFRKKKDDSAGTIPPAN